MSVQTETQYYCHDEKHGTPCPLPCPACEEECNHDQRSESDHFEMYVLSASDR